MFPCYPNNLTKWKKDPFLSYIFSSAFSLTLPLFPSTSMVQQQHNKRCLGVYKYSMTLFLSQRLLLLSQSSIIVGFKGYLPPSVLLNHHYSQFKIKDMLHHNTKMNATHHNLCPLLTFSNRGHIQAQHPNKMKEPTIKRDSRSLKTMGT